MADLQTAFLVASVILGFAIALFVIKMIDDQQKLKEELEELKFKINKKRIVTQ